MIVLAIRKVVLAEAATIGLARLLFAVASLAVGADLETLDFGFEVDLEDELLLIKDFFVIAIGIPQNFGFEFLYANIVCNRRAKLQLMLYISDMSNEIIYLRETLLDRNKTQEDMHPVKN